MKKTTPGFIYMVMASSPTYCSLLVANHMVKSGPITWEWNRKLYSSQAVGTVGWTHAFFGCQERQPRLRDERITSALKGTEWLIPLQPLDTQSLKLSHFLPPGTNNTFPLTTTFTGLQCRSQCIPQRCVNTMWNWITKKVAWVSKCHL